MPGAPSINDDGCFTLTCIKCGKTESIKPIHLSTQRTDAMKDKKHEKKEKKYEEKKKK